MAKKANAGERRAEAQTEPRIEQAVEKKETPKLSVHDKTRLRKQELGKIIAYAKQKLADESDHTDAQVELQALCAKYSKPHKDLGEPTWSKKLRDLFGSNTRLHEDAIWLDHKFGRETMQNLIKDALHREKPALRFWVNFDAETGEYVVYGTGKEAPEGYPEDAIRPKERTPGAAKRSPAGSTETAPADVEFQSA